MRALALGIELGVPHRPSQTPSEYLHDLKITFVNQEAELEQIPAAYIDLRYGESPTYLNRCSSSPLPGK